LIELPLSNFNGNRHNAAMWSVLSETRNYYI